MPPAKAARMRPEEPGAAALCLPRPLEQAAMGGGAPKLFSRSWADPGSQPPVNKPRGRTSCPKKLLRQPASARNVSGDRGDATVEQRNQLTFRPGRDWC